MDYQKTLNLPQTDFAMKAGLVQKEPLALARWNNDQIYQRIRANAKKILKLAVPAAGRLKKFSAANALQFAIMTDRAMIPAEKKKELEIIIGKYL